MLNYHKRRWFQFLSLALATYCMFQNGCVSANRNTFVPQDAALQKFSEGQYLKAHLKNGHLWVFSSFTFNDHQSSVYGTCRKYDVTRHLIIPSAGPDTLSYAEVVLFETNTTSYTSGSVAYMVIAVSIGILGIYCAANPKACFGSCPTFYAWDGHAWRLQAEGFSASILPALEERDIDALSSVRPQSPDFVLKMKNEAYETHVVRHINLIAVKKRIGERVFQTNGDEFFAAQSIQKPLQCSAAEGDITTTISSLDSTERFSEADSVDLAAREIIEAEFLNNPDKQSALIVGFRQTLMSTYLFYQTLAYMGTNAGSWLSKIQMSKNPGAITKSISDVLGGIDVEVFDGQNWLPCGSIFETGPIAQNQQAVILPRVHTPTTKLRLRMTKGYWRINSIELASVQAATDVLILKPYEVRSSDTVNADALNRLRDERQTLNTVRGDEYDISYHLPDNFSEYDYFVDSKGYYLEWLRKEWEGEESSVKVSQLFLSPRDFIREETTRFKQVEPGMEQSFWSSRYVQQP